jgi:hypothetical protein
MRRQPVAHEAPAELAIENVEADGLEHGLDLVAVELRDMVTVHLDEVALAGEANGVVGGEFEVGNLDVNAVEAMGERA